MAKKDTMGLSVKKSDDMSEWYNQVVLKAGLADYSAVKGFMIIKPYGYAIWENIQAYFDKRIKALGVKNAYFPLLIPESFFKKEAEHAEGFSPEVAWIANKEDGERLAIRPTSETVMYDAYSKWIRSWRDLPLRINQWCNVVRWETKMTKLFLRTREFLWQEGHCVYATEKECEKETQIYMDEYVKVCEDLLAVPVLTGRKTENEKFAGANYTLAMEAFMPDGKALQMGTSHNLGQSFAKSFKIDFLGKDEKKHFPWQNSWGISTRLIGGLVMVHGDDKGLVLPPSIAPIQIVIIPIVFDKSKKKVLDTANKIKNMLNNPKVELDDRDEYTPGWKYNEWELKGVPIRIEIGPRDLEQNQVIIARRDTGEKKPCKIKDTALEVEKILKQIQKNLFNKAKKILEDAITQANTFDELQQVIKNKKIAKVLFCGKPTCEELIKDKTGGATSRCIIKEKKGKCIHCNKQASVEVYFSKSY